MLYKPNFCSHCGEKIERIEWFPWTSRRFCEVCETDFKIHEWLPRVFLSAAVLSGLIGFGGYLKSGEKPLPEGLEQKKTGLTKSDRPLTNQAVNSQISANADVKSGPPQTEQNENAVPSQPVSQPSPAKSSPVKNAPGETVGFCAAQTKKGTPCSRRVKGGGRCWQHEGQPAMPAQEKSVAGR